MIEPSFFVLGLPRHGTTWLARAFSAMNPEVLVNHEAIREDFQMDRVACFRPWEATEYVGGRRAESIADRLQKRPKFTRYGEVTPRARYFASALRNRYRSATFVHLVRDPRSAVPSLMNYGYYLGPHGRRHRTEAPDGGRWTPVQRASWAWAYGHERIRTALGPASHSYFEALVDDYESFAGLAHFLGLQADSTVWEERRRAPANPSQNSSTPPYKKWPPSWRDQMWDMLGKEAEAYGYQP